MSSPYRQIVQFLPVMLLLSHCAATADWESAGIGDSEPLELVDIRELPDGDEVIAAEFAEDPSDPEVVLTALSRAYPDRVSLPEYRDGDWSVVVGDTLIYWADGRMLSFDLRDRSEDYSAYGFRPHPIEMPPLRTFTPAEEERLKSRIDRRESLQDGRHPLFMNALWGMENADIAERTVVRVEFLGRGMRIHPGILEPLAEVERLILDAAEDDEKVTRWMAELGAVSCYVWRDIAGSANRSLHSYGIAVDVTPKDYRGKAAYWRWTTDFRDDWWAVPYSERHQIPDAVVQAFEENGFIWGGKWLLFDQIHFEYRPELIILGRIAQEQKG